METRYELIKVKQDVYDIALHRFHLPGSHGTPVLLVHGSIENGRIFYSNAGKGLAPFLASEGYDVFVFDYRGRGASTPSVNKESDFGLYEMLQEDFPKVVQEVRNYTNNKAQIWMAHSWGGVMLLAYYARNYAKLDVKSMVFFACKRRITVKSLYKFYLINFGWNFLSKLLIRIYGYLPAKRFKIGADDESKGTYKETCEWLYHKEWLGIRDRPFNYLEELRKLDLPPILSITGSNDKVLGHPKDVQILLDEIQAQNATFKIIGKAYGHKEDYDHISILTSKNCPQDHFKDILTFIQSERPILTSK